MTKKEFLTELERRLSGLSEEDIARSLEYYSEMIDERMDEGMSEHEAVRDLGDMDGVVSSVLAATPIKRLIGAKLEKKHALKGWHIALILLGAPLWIPLLIALLAVIFAVFVTLFALAFSAFAVVFSFGASVVACFAGGVLALLGGRPQEGAVGIGLALFFAGLTVLLTLLAIVFAKWMFKLIGAFVLFIKSRFVGKER